MSDRLEPARQGKHLDFLDGLRGFAVSYVLLYHFLPKTLSLTNNNVFTRAWDSFWLLGWSGVDLFFVLSGFLITGILYKAKSGKNYFKNFYIRRFFRIFPAYYVLIIISIIYFGKENISGLYWLYLSNFDVEFSIPFNNFLCVAWSLSIEEQYYLFYPTLVYFLDHKKWVKVLVGFIILSISLRFLGHYFDFFTPRQMYHNTLAHFDGIALGGLLRVLIFNYEPNARLLHFYRKLTPVLLVAALCLAYYCSMEVLKEAVKPDGTVHLGHVSFFPAMYLFGYTLNSLLFGGIILCCLFKNGIAYRIFSNPVLRNIGKYSYAMYIFQFPAYFLYHFIIGKLNWAPNPFLQGALLFLTCYLVARLSWLVLESPMNKLKERLTHKKEPA